MYDKLCFRLWTKQENSVTASAPVAGRPQLAMMFAKLFSLFFVFSLYGDNFTA
jgi:hypothetical protein